MASDRDKNRNQEGASILDLDYRLPSSPQAYGPPAPAGPTDRTPPPPAVDGDPPGFSEITARIEGTHDARAGTSSVGLKAASSDANGAVTLGDGPQGLSLDARFNFTDGKNQAYAEVGKPAGGGAINAQLGYRFADDLVDVNVGTRNRQEYVTIAGKGNIQGVDVAGKAVFSDGQDSFTASATKKVDDVSFTATATVPGTARLGANYTRDGVSIAAGADTDGAITANLTYARNLGGSAASGAPGVSTDFRGSAAALNEWNNYFSGQNSDGKSHGRSEPPFPDSFPVRPGSDGGRLNEHPVDAIRPNPQLVSDATQHLEALNRELPVGASHVRVNEAAESLAFLAEKHGLSRIGFVELGNSLQDGGRNIFIGKENSSREQVAANAEPIFMNAETAARGPTPELVKSITEQRESPLQATPEPERQQSYGGRSLG